MLSVLANSPTATMLQRPAMPCTALAPTGSSTWARKNIFCLFIFFCTFSQTRPLVPRIARNAPTAPVMTASRFEMFAWVWNENKGFWVHHSRIRPWSWQCQRGSRCTRASRQSFPSWWGGCTQGPPYPRRSWPGWRWWSPGWRISTSCHWSRMWRPINIYHEEDICHCLHLIEGDPGPP